MSTDVTMMSVKEGMVIKDDIDHLMFIEPSGAPSPEPVIDKYTRRMAAAWRSRRQTDMYTRGVHCCTGADCVAVSDNGEHFVRFLSGRELATNSLSVHYLAFHRNDVPPLELVKLNSLTEEVEPSEAEMLGLEHQL